LLEIGASIKGIRVLVVEDDDDTRELLGLMLESNGADTILTNNVSEGLEAVRKNRPDIIVADIGMPEYNGYAFIAALRKEAQSEIRSTPVIALTAYATPADRDTALISGFNDHMAKPFEPDRLIGAIERLHSKHRIDHAA
jgi:CheY-like chemotaxis protein